MIEKTELINFHNLLSGKIITRDGDCWIFDLNKFKQEEPYQYDNFISKHSLDKIKELKKQAKDLFEIDKFKIINFETMHPISELRIENLDELVCVKGMVTKTTKVVAYVEESKWECLSCGNTLITKKDRKPPRCGCGNKQKFNPIEALYRNLQEIEIEEPQDELEGRQPQKIRVRLFDELTDKCLSGALQPGNKVSILGVVEKSEMVTKSDDAMFEYRLLALELNSLEEQFYTEETSEEDMLLIQEISADNPLEKLAESLVPSIYGNEEIKKALVLQMVGGVKKKKQDGTSSRDRLHLLLVGEPGAGKSRMGKAVHLRMPKSYFISGDSTTKAGLAGVVDRDQLLNEWMLQAGALSKCNDSILIIDECDKLNAEDREALHTPMEAGIIPINKATIRTTLKADCSILAIANPKEGIFELSGSKTIVQQVNLPPPLMSRFDIIFILIDEINQQKDYSIAEKIYAEDVEVGIPIPLFRKYIAYARKMKPILRQETLKNLSHFYHQIRKKSISNNSTLRGMPITPRHLEGIIRLSEASAKIRLSEYVEEQDFEIAKKIFYDSLVKLGLDEETGTLDMARVGGGKTFSKKQKAGEIIRLMNETMNKYNSEYVYEQKLKTACLERGMEAYEFEDILFELAKNGDILRDTQGLKLHPSNRVKKEREDL
jgi:replicative DNA helicase Mcm